MGSIAKSVRIVKGNMGIKVEGQRGHYYGVEIPRRQRGDIKGFSSASRRRLREVLVMASPRTKKYKPYGVCFTIPGKVLKPGDISRLWFDWRNDYLSKRYSKNPLIWRIELQKRRQAHWHCIFWGEQIEVLTLRSDWLRFIRRRLGPFTERVDFGFEEHGCRVDDLSASSATGIIGYVCDHTSKHKQEQLGWIGRQWGLVNRSQLNFEGKLLAELSEDEHIIATRQYRRLQERLRERGGKYTGVRITPNGDISTAVFGNDERRFIDCVRLAQNGGGRCGSSTDCARSQQANDN